MPRPPIVSGMLMQLLLLSSPLGVFALSASASSSSESCPPPPKSWHKAADQAVDALSNAKSVLFVTGAGISAEAGLPTYRGVSGLYNSDNGLIRDEGMTIEECLSGSTYRTKPEITWKYLLQIERSCRGARPSRAHELLAEAERHVKPGPVTVMTQNVDGLHVRAGSTDVTHLHGNLHHLKCTNPSCGHQFEVESFEEIVGDDQEIFFPPPCPKCNKRTVRPNIILFDEYLGDDTVQRYEAKLGKSMGELSLLWYDLGRPSSRRHAPYDVSICIGTSALFAYVNAAALSGKRTIEINPTQTSLSDLVDVHVQSGATEALEYIYDKLGWK